MFDLINIHQLVDSLIMVLDARDPYTFEHSERVACLSEVIAEKMNLDEYTVALIHFAAHLHDIGKAGIPDYVLNKKGVLTREEFTIMKSHPVIGFNIIKNIDILQDLSTLVLYHHEKWDGSGYPEGLSGNDIPFGSCIIAIADSFDAMTSKRSYKDEMSIEDSFLEIERVRGTQFNPDVVDCFLSLKEEIPEILRTVNNRLEHHAFKHIENLLFNRSSSLI